MIAVSIVIDHTRQAARKSTCLVASQKRGSRARILGIDNREMGFGLGYLELRRDPPQRPDALKLVLPQFNLIRLRMMSRKQNHGTANGRKKAFEMCHGFGMVAYEC